MKELTEKQVEALIILQEECAELTVAVAKVLRFGPDNYHPDTKVINQAQLAAEIGHVSTMLDVVIDGLEISIDRIQLFRQSKMDSLRQYSGIYKDTTLDTDAT